MPIYRMFLHVHVQGIYAVFSVTIAKQKGWRASQSHLFVPLCGFQKVFRTATAKLNMSQERPQ
jgi:hypothetical protein